jgi:hypothetical protein
MLHQGAIATPGLGQAAIVLIYQETSQPLKAPEWLPDVHKETSHGLNLMSWNVEPDRYPQPL